MNNPFANGYRAIIRALASKSVRYAFQVGLAEDDLFDAITGGNAGETFSLRNATEAKAGDREACWVCWNLGWIVQPDHCALTLGGQNIPPVSAIRACMAITIALALPALIWWHPLWIGGGFALALAVDIMAFNLVAARKI
ncbi:MAG TPA: hypothetical protein PK677_11140 [Acidiphilium sp.]|nr:hypothetical protein [Acidiphilium sp.]